MAKVQFHPLVKHLRGTINGLVFRLSHNGETSAYPRPDMSRVKWSAAQQAHRERFAEASAYARAAIADPAIRAIYVQMSMEKKGNKRPYDTALSDYYQNRNNLLGDAFRWDTKWWRETKRYSTRRKQQGSSNMKW